MGQTYKKLEYWVLGDGVLGNGVLEVMKETIMAIFIFS